MSDNLELDRVTEKREAPAKAWRNLWVNRFAGFVDCMTCQRDHWIEAGHYISCAVFPSREVAEASGRELDDENVATCDQPVRFICPVPA